MSRLYKRRFAELADQLEKLQASKELYKGRRGRVGGYTVDGTDLLEWKVKVRSLLVSVCGPDSVHLSQFEKAEVSTASTNYESLQKLAAVFRAAREDYEGGYLASMRAIVQAELFDSELEQARELAAKGFALPAAVVAGVVLETALRELCDRESITHAKLDRMNAELAKAGVYSKLQQKRITALAEIRNLAAHGRSEKFSKEDVDDMIRDVEGLVRKNLA